MSGLEMYRSLLVFCYMACVLQVTWFLIEYVRVILPLKDSIAAGDLLAPPKWVTLEYHVWVAYLLFFLGIGVAWAQHIGAPFNIITVFMFPALIRLFFVLRKFRMDYTERLQRWGNQPVDSGP